MTLIIAAVAIFLRRRIRDYALARADNPSRTRYSGPITVVFGAVLGVLVSLCSVGAGALGLAMLFFLYPRLPPVRIVGSDLAHAVPLTLVAGLGHWLIGSVDWHIVGALLLGSLPGISIGSYLATRISDRFLLPVLASMLVLQGGAGAVPPGGIANPHPGGSGTPLGRHKGPVCGKPPLARSGKTPASAPFQETWF